LCLYIFKENKNYLGNNIMSDVPIVVSDSDFDDQVLKSSNPVLVDFWAPWCAPCKNIEPIITELSKEYSGRAIIAKMNVDENANVPVNYGVRSIPYIALFKDGKVVDSLVGSVPKEKLTQMLDKYIG
jgi:thioredoxin 1